MKYTTKNTLVKGQGYSYNLNNKHDANKLCEKLNNYETTITNLKKTIQTETNLDKLHQQVIALQMDLKVVQEDLDKIKELLK
jgi:uncharacterized membrane protein